MSKVTYHIQVDATAALAECAAILKELHSWPEGRPFATSDCEYYNQRIRDVGKLLAYGMPICVHPDDEAAKSVPLPLSGSSHLPQ